MMTKDRICRTCEYRRPLTNGSGLSDCAGPQRERADSIRGIYVDPAPCEYERSRFWAWLGFPTCGPTGRWWAPIAERGKPPPANR